LNFIRKHKNTFLLKLFSVNSLGVICRSVLGIISQKIVALSIGPEGIAYVGNLKNALALLSSTANVGIDSGVIKFQSKFEKDPTQLKKLYSTSLMYSLLGSLCLSVILLIRASYWSLYLFDTKTYGYLFIILGLTIPFTALYNLCFAVINGQSNYKKATIITFSTYAIVSLMVICFVLLYNLSGVLLAIILTPIAQSIALLIFAKKEARNFLSSKIKFDNFFRNKLVVFIIMSFAAVFFSNVIDIKLRNYIIDQISAEQAGYWTSMLTISTYYLSFITGVYSLYVLPKYAKIITLVQFKIELKHIFEIILPIFACMFVVIYLIKKPLVMLLYSDEFLPTVYLFKWQLLGDFIKIISMIIAYQFIAQQLWKLFILTEIVSYLLFYLLGLFFVDKFGVEGITIAHFVRYIFYLLFVVYLMKFMFKNNQMDNEQVQR